MSYASMAALEDDAVFRDRVYICCREQALVFKDDGRNEFKLLADSIIRSPDMAAGVFNLVVVSPNFKDTTDSTTVADIEILSVVQYNWPIYGATLLPPAA